MGFTKREVKHMNPYVMALIVALTGAGIDLKEGRVPNSLILICYLLGLFYQLSVRGAIGILYFLGDAIWPILLLYPVFLIRGLGAGDVKLFSGLSTFLRPGLTIQVIIGSMFCGALYSIVRNLGRRSMKGWSEGSLSFAMCIASAYLCVIMREVWIK